MSVQIELLGKQRSSSSFSLWGNYANSVPHFSLNVSKLNENNIIQTQRATSRSNLTPLSDVPCLLACSSITFCYIGAFSKLLFHIYQRVPLIIKVNTNPSGPFVCSAPQCPYDTYCTTRGPMSILYGYTCSHKLHTRPLAYPRAECKHIEWYYSHSFWLTIGHKCGPVWHPIASHYYHRQTHNTSTQYQ